MTRSIQEAQRAVDRLAERLLPGWDVRVEPDYPSDCDPEADAAVTAWTDHTFEAVIHFTDASLALTDYSFNRLILHELMHPLFREMRQHVDRLLMGLDDLSAAREVRLYEHQEELIVERVAQAVYYMDA